MRFILILLLSLMAFLSSCKKDVGYTCKCEFPFLTGNTHTTFIAVRGESYWHNNDCWTYLGPTKSPWGSPPSSPGQNSAEWRKCGDIHKDCNTLSASTPTWTARVYYKGDKVKLNNKIFIAYTQGSPMPESSSDDIWAKLCE